MVCEVLRRDLAYLKGLLDTSDQNKQETKALLRFIDTVDQLVEKHERLERRLSKLEEYVEMIDEDLNDLELMAEAEMDDEEFVEMVCPECGEEVLISEADLDDQTLEHLCPRCHTVLELEEATDEDIKEMIKEEALVEVGRS